MYSSKQSEVRYVPLLGLYITAFHKFYLKHFRHRDCRQNRPHGKQFVTKRIFNWQAAMYLNHI